MKMKKTREKNPFYITQKIQESKEDNAFSPF